MKDLTEDFQAQNPIKPFWSWNDQLENGKLVRQIKEMKSAGIGGFFMHARGGLVTEYLGKDWLCAVEACLDAAKESGMEAWVYDENGWPSGFANGIVPKKGDAFCQKWLETGIYDAENPVAYPIAFYRIGETGYSLLEKPETGCMVIHFGINRYYVDTFNPAAIACFIENTHEKYYQKFGERFGSDLKGFFTDEPQYCNNGCAPWSPVFPQLFRERFGYGLIEKLPLLYYEFEGYAAFRSDFYNMASDRFKESFIKQMYDWCESHGCKLTGHMMAEDNLVMQMNTTLGVMSCYEYFHEPGIDWLGRIVANDLLPKQLGSAAAQLQKKTLVEIFALCGWDVSLNELKWVAQWQLVNGVTSLCPHVAAYSIRGYRKRDYPASLFEQLPWFEAAYPTFSRYFTRLGALLDAGRDAVPVLMLHAIQSAYVARNPRNGDRLAELDKTFNTLVSEMSNAHIPHHYGDETIIKHHGSVENGRLKVGACDYGIVLLPAVISLTSETAKLLLKLIEQGGKVFAVVRKPLYTDGRSSNLLTALNEKVVLLDAVSALRGEIPDEDFVSIAANGTENANIRCCRRIMPDGRYLYYLVNMSEQKQRIVFAVKGEYHIKMLPILSDVGVNVHTEYADHTTKVPLLLDEYGSAVLQLDSAAAEECFASENAENLPLDSHFTIKKCSENALTLDYCELRIDGGAWQPEKPVIWWQEKLLSLRKSCETELRFRFHIASGGVPGKITLCAETPEKYTFAINGMPVQFEDCGFFTDDAIRRFDITRFVKTGENVITMQCLFCQEEQVYRTLFTPGIHETERNKLTYSTELESIYLVGNFGVKMAADYRLGERRCLYAGRNFSIVEPKKEVAIGNITAQDYWFFSGRMTLSQKITVSVQKNREYYVRLQKLFAPAARLVVNGSEAGIFAFAPYVLYVTNLLRDGENEIEIELLSGNRNLLGPHHRPIGESHFVCPATFTDKPDWTDKPTDSMWTDNYNFVLFGAEL